MGFLKKITGKLFGGDELTGGYDQAIGAQREMYNTARGDLAPWRAFGESYIPNLRDLKPFQAPSMDDVKSRPGYQFRMDQGTRALDNSAISKGGLLSGNHLRDVMSFGQDYGSSEYDKEYGRSQSQYQNELARLMQFANLGYGAAGGSAGIAQNAGNSLSNLYAGRGQAGAEVAQFPWKLGAGVLGSMLGRG